MSVFCLRTGKALRAVQYNALMRYHPDTGRICMILGTALGKLLNLSAACYEMSGLGYIGTDIVLDKNVGCCCWN